MSNTYMYTKVVNKAHELSTVKLQKQLPQLNPRNNNIDEMVKPNDLPVRTTKGLMGH